MTEEPPYVYRGKKAYRGPKKFAMEFRNELIRMIDDTCGIDDVYLKAIDLYLHIIGITKLDNMDDFDRWCSLGVISESMNFTDGEMHNSYDDHVFVTLNLLREMWIGRIIQIFDEGGNITYIRADYKK